MSQATVNLTRSVLWTPYKELYSTVEAAIIRKEQDAIPELEVLLKLHKPHFVSLLRNPVRSPLHKAALLRAPTEGIAVVGQNTLHILPQSIVDEALVISEMFELNELTAVELLISAQHQQPSYPGLTRGLVAVLLYYDGRRSLVNSLRALVQAREGRTWTYGLSKELGYLITKYTDQLREDGIITKIFDLLENLNPISEVELLQKNRAFGGPRYRQQVIGLIDEIKQSLADTLFSWSCQATLSILDTKRFVHYLATADCVKGDGTLDSVALTILMGILYTIDVSILQTSEEIDEMVKKYPLIHDPQLIRAIHKELIMKRNWEVPGIESILYYAWSITLRTLAQYPWAISNANVTDCLEMDEKVMDLALNLAVFRSATRLIAKSDVFHKEEFFLKKMHSLITDFITLMPLKVKELRNQGDELARIIAAHIHEGLEPPQHENKHFEHLLVLIESVYEKDPLELELALDFWRSSDATMDTSYGSRPTQRQVNLYKFLRLSGDLLPAPLFVPYINMLTSLSQSRVGSHQCYIVLKANGRGSGSQSIVSWDHFFESLHQYYSNLRQEIPITSETQHLYRQRSYAKGITPQEVEGLCAVLKLLATVVEYDEMGRVALWENPQYVPGMVVIGLITCSVPPEVKASLLEVLASFAHSPDITGNIWQQLELSQIIPTVKTLSRYPSTGIQMDLTDVESRMEEYPITKAALKLIKNLINHPLPLTLGAGHRAPGFQPYLEYVKDTVFLQFHTRSYKFEGEKWHVSQSCLEILLKLLKDYQVSQNDFVNQLTELPGFTLMVQLFQGSQLLSLILLILDEGTRVLDTYTSLSWRKSLDNSTLLCLKMIHEALRKQDEFLENVRSHGSSQFATSMDRLLLSINPVSGQPDYMVVITKYISYNIILPEHALYSVLNLEMLCRISQVAQQLAATVKSNNTLTEVVISGFVECLDKEEGEVKDAGNKMREDSNASHQSETRTRILQLLLNCLNHNCPNISHLLLGFQTRQGISKTVLQDPGILNSPRTCLHSVLSILDRGCETKGYPLVLRDNPKLADMSYQLLYVLCYNKDTTGPTLRYLRTNRDFVYRHIHFLPLTANSQDDEALTFSQQSWLLKILAIELRVLVKHNQRSHVQRLLKLLLEDSAENRDQTEVELLDSTARSSLMTQSTNITGTIRRKLLRILDAMDFAQKWPAMPNLEYLDPLKVEKAISQCESEETNEKKIPIVNVYQLHKLLTEDLPTLQGIPALSHRPPFANEIRSVLQYVLQKNKTRQTIFSKYQAFEAWRHVTEVIFAACILDHLTPALKQQIILEISQELLVKILEDEALPELTSPASGVLLILMTTLRNSLVSLSKETPTILATSSSSLAVVLKGVLECLTKTGNGNQRVRINYYGTILNLLGIVQKSLDTKMGESKSLLDIRVLDRESDIEKLKREFLSVILNFGESLIDVVCRDACGGHHVTKMSALAVMETVISLENSRCWQSFLESKGYLRHLITSLSKEDEELQKLLSNGSDSIQTLFVFESKLSLLIRVSGSLAGAEALLRCGLISTLRECESLDLRPEKDYSVELTQGFHHEDVLKERVQRFQQILKPVFSLVLSVVTTLGDQHYESATQLLHFITAHSEIFNVILRDKSILSITTSAEEFSLVTSLLARASFHLMSSNNDNAVLEKRGQVLLLRNRLLSFLPTVVSVIINATNVANNFEELKLKVILLQIITNTLISCQKEVSRAFASRNEYLSKAIFLPNLMGVNSTQDPYFNGRNTSFTQRGVQPPTLGLLVTLIQNCSEQLNFAINTKKKIEQNLQSINILSVGELNDWLPPESRSDNLTQQLREQAQHTMTRLSRIRCEEITHLSYIIEGSLFLLWRHLEYFLKRCVPEEKENHEDELNFSGQSFNHQESRNLTSFKVTKADLELLKDEISNAINDRWFLTVQTVQDYISSNTNQAEFLPALLRRVKRLVKINLNSK